MQSARVAKVNPVRILKKAIMRITRFDIQAVVSSDEVSPLVTMNRIHVAGCTMREIGVHWILVEVYTCICTLIVPITFALAFCLGLGASICGEALAMKTGSWKR